MLEVVCALAHNCFSVFSIHFFALILTFGLGFISFFLVCTSFALLLDSPCALAHHHYSGIFSFIFSLFLSMFLSLFCLAPTF